MWLTFNEENIIKGTKKIFFTIKYNFAEHWRAEGSDGGTNFTCFVIILNNDIPTRRQSNQIQIVQRIGKWVGRLIKIFYLTKKRLCIGTPNIKSSSRFYRLNRELSSLVPNIQEDKMSWWESIIKVFGWICLSLFWKLPIKSGEILSW